MSSLQKLITDAELERKMETILIEGKGRIDAVCENCGGLMIVHKRGQCSRSEAKKVLTSEIKLQLLEKMEDFRQIVS